MISAYDYIKSESIKKYLKEIKYEFQPLEIAAFIHKFGNNSIDEKFSMFEKLMEEYADSDMSGKYSAGFDYSYTTWHNALKAYIKYKKASYESYFKSNEKNLYRYKIFDDYEPISYGEDKIFSSYEKCLKDVLRVINLGDIPIYPVEKFDSFYIKKLLLDDKLVGIADFNKFAKMVDIYAYDDVSVENPGDSLEEYGPFTILPNLPVPFKDGDILCYPDKKNIPVYIYKCEERKNLDRNGIYDFDIYTLDEMGKLVDRSLDAYNYGELDKWTTLDYYKGIEGNKQLLLDYVKKEIERPKKNC